MGSAFNANSAYAYIQAQCDFGPYTMNSEMHEQCANWIVRKFQQFGYGVTTQKTGVKDYDGTALHAASIMAKYEPEATECILFCAHRDNRPWADSDPDSTNRYKPTIAANDGASGITVMLELARLLQDDTTLTYGIDSACFDAEDWSASQWEEQSGGEGSWVLGAQYWAENASHDNRPECSILLGMVGGQEAKLYRELASKQYAPNIVEKVWAAAEAASYGSYFPRQDEGYITDDYIPVSGHAEIPAIDIIPFYPDYPQSSFGPTWHTTHNTVEHIDRNTLKAAGQTVVQALFSGK